MFVEREASCILGAVVVEISVVSGVMKGRSRRCLDMPEGQTQSPSMAEIPPGSRTGESNQPKQFGHHTEFRQGKVFRLSNQGDAGAESDNGGSSQMLAQEKIWILLPSFL